MMIGQTHCYGETANSHSPCRFLYVFLDQGILIGLEDHTCDEQYLNYKKTVSE